MLSEEVLGAPRVTADRVRALAAAAVRRVWGLEEAVVVVAGGDVGKRPRLWKGSYRSMDMKSTSAKASLSRLLWIAGTLSFLWVPSQLTAQHPAAKTAPALAAVGAKTFDTPQQAADALVAAAEQFDERALKEIFGPNGEDIVFSGEYPQDRRRASDFAAEAREKKRVSVDSRKRNRAFLLVGKQE